MCSCLVVSREHYFLVVTGHLWFTAYATFLTVLPQRSVDLERRGYDLPVPFRVEHS